jgi:hypothetical protein
VRPAQVSSRRAPSEGSKAATTGGVAVAFAVAACASVSLYGVGGGGAHILDVGKGGGRSYADSASQAAPGGVHNLKAERRWLDTLVRSGRARPVCY